MGFEIDRLGTAEKPSPLGLSRVSDDKIGNFIQDDAKIVVNHDIKYWKECLTCGHEPSFFELAGPRESVFFDPAETKAAIVTCGGLCPGLNDVIRALVMQLHYHYHVQEILGVRYGYRGMTVRQGGTSIPLTPDIVAKIHTEGGSFLGSSRGPQSEVEMVDFLQRREINMLFIIGGDGTLRGALKLVEECRQRQLPVSIIGIPKTIDNDIAYIDRSFGFSTAFTKAKEIISCAHVEAHGAYNGIGLVKLMGRYSGYIAARAALASGEANFVLIPEVPFELSGPNGFLAHLEKRILNRRHAVIVVAEGAGQELIENKTVQVDESGNPLLMDIGSFLKNEITTYFKARNINIHMRYFDPSYIIRSTPANAEDNIYCIELAQHAVHAAFSGRTGMIVGNHHYHFVHIPMSAAVSFRKKLDPEGSEWLTVVESTGQPKLMINQL